MCIEHDSKRGLQRWNFPFKSLEIYREYENTQKRKLTCDEIQKYMSER